MALVMCNDATTGQLLWRIKAPASELAAVGRHPTRDVVASTGAERVPSLYAVDGRSLIRRLETQDGPIFSLWHFAPTVAAFDSPLRLTMSESSEFDTRERTAICNAHTGPFAPAFRPDGEQLALGGRDGKVHICDVKSGRVVRELRLRHNLPKWFVPLLA
jgi:hypothetical protein